MPTSNSSWRRPIARILRRPRNPDRPARAAIVGIGNELRGDDAAGPLAARALLGLAGALVIDAGSAPENCTGALRRFQPDLVILIDAADLGDAPGTARWLDWRDTTGLSASTHTLPLHLLGQYLSSELGCQVGVLGVQPASLAFDAPVSDAILRAVEEIADGLAGILAGGQRDENESEDG